MKFNDKRRIGILEGAEGQQNTFSPIIIKRSLKEATDFTESNL